MAKSYTLSNGKTVQSPKNKAWIYMLVVAILFSGSFFFIPIEYSSIKLDQFPVIFVKMFSPAAGKTWGDYFGFMLTIGGPLFDTIKMSFSGTIIGSFFAFPLAVLASENITKKPWIYQSVRAFMNIIRTIPTMVLAVIATFFVGLGILSGIMAITIFTFGIMVKMLYEVIETVDMGPFEALEACGGKKIPSFRFAIFPQILPIFLSYLIYIFEINVRASAILGYVGAGGIGELIQENILYNYDRVGAIVIVLFVLVGVIQFTSNAIRSKLQ